MTFTLPNLPYAHDALAPHMSKETLEYHHDKHHQAYVTNGNNAIKGTEFEGKSLEEIVKGSFGKNPAVFNNAGQHYNHLHFWNWMKPNGGGSKLPGRLEKKITEDLGGLEKFKTDFAAAGAGQFGSGWCWLSVKNGKLEISKTPNGENPLVHGATPILGCRRLGAFLLHRLSQPPSGLPQGVRRSSGELGICRPAVLESLTRVGSDGSFRGGSISCRLFVRSHFARLARLASLRQNRRLRDRSCRCWGLCDELLLVFFGGGLGASLRHFVNVACARCVGTAFPYGTFIINITGSTVMGLIAGYLAFKGEASQPWRLFVMTGILGGYTTFSAFSLDTALLYERGQIGLALFYVLGSVRAVDLRACSPALPWSVHLA